MRKKVTTYNCNKGKKLNKLYNRIHIIVGLIEWFKNIINFNDEQLIECLDKNDIWKWLNEEMLECAFAWGHDADYKDTLEFFNPSLKEDEITFIVKEYEGKIFNWEYWEKNEEEIEKRKEDENNIIRLATVMIKFLIVNKKMPPEEAFKQWYHSATKQYIDRNSLYCITGKQCKEMYKKELSKKES